MQTTTALAAEVVRSGAHAARVAHAALFDRVLERIERYFRRMVREPHEADDCVQQTMLLLEESLTAGKYDAERSFNAWMWLKARTVFAQWCRERERRPASLEAEPAAPARGHRGAIDRSIDARAVLDAIRARLGEEAFEVFVLYYEGGLIQADVAQAVGRDLKTVRKRLAAAHELIDRLLRDAPASSKS